MRAFHLNSPALILPRRFVQDYSREHQVEGQDKACWCALCDKPVDSEQLSDVGGKRMEIVVKHHGLEESRRVWWDSESDNLEDALKVVRNRPFFTPADVDPTNATEIGSSNA